MGKADAGTLPGKVSEVGVRLPRGLSRDRLIDAARLTGKLGRANPWIGADVMLYAEEHFGEEAAQISEELGWAAQTRANAMWVGRVFPHKRRRSYPLTFGHHAEVAKLDTAEQDEWLDKAAKGDGPELPWSVARLRRELKGPSAEGASAAEAAPEPEQAVVLARGLRVRHKGHAYRVTDISVGHGAIALIVDEISG